MKPMRRDHMFVVAIEGVHDVSYLTETKWYYMRKKGYGEDDGSNWAITFSSRDVSR